AVALVALLLIGLLYRVLLAADVGGQREMNDNVISWGGLLTQRMTLTNSSRLRAPTVRLTDASTLPEHPHGYVTSLRAHRSITWEIDITCFSRGRFRLGPVEATMSDPLGLFPVRRRIGETASVLVLPRWVPLRRTALKLDGFMPGEARSQRRGEAPPSVSSVRDYSAGDAMAAIHWPATARAGRLLTKQFDPEVQTTLWLALDLDSSRDGELSKEVEELLVTATTSLGLYALGHAQLRVGLVASGAMPISLPSDRGMPQRYRLQEALAEAHAGDAVLLADALTTQDRQFGAGQVVALVTSRGPDVWQGWLSRQRQRGIAVRVVDVRSDDVGADGAKSSRWSVSAITLPVELGAFSEEPRLIAALEAGR
ncbi:MAG: DUF58 domain-containing protein, partial [Ktedonobacterales bacterium]